jgi:hypothetical protein
VFALFDSALLGGIGYCFRVGWHPAGLPPHGIHWQRFCTHYYFFDSAPLGGIGYWLELRSSVLANTSTLVISRDATPQGWHPLKSPAKPAPNVCLSEPSLFGDADLKASAGAPRQSRSRQHPIPLAVRSRSYTKRALPCKREPWSAKPCLLPSERAMPVSCWFGACFIRCAIETRGDVRLAYRQFKWCQLVGTFLCDYRLMLSLLERTASGVGRCRQCH